MSATKEITIDKLGIIAGGGSLPAYLLSICNDKNIEPYVVGLEGQADLVTLEGQNHIWTNMGSVNKILKYFKKNNVKDLVMIGHVKRPSLFELKPDLKALKMLSRVSLKSLGDNDLLSGLKAELENEGFKIHGIQHFCENLLIKEGALGKHVPNKDDLISIEVGINISQKIGALDIGQSVIVQDGIIIGIEAVEGTDGLIKRCKPLLKKGGKAILVKTCKPQQDKDLDLPTIGIETVKNAYSSGLKGIAVQADNTLIVDPKNVAQYADKYKIFVHGVLISA